MVSLKSLIASSLLVIPFASARITNLSAPATAQNGTNVTAVLNTESYIQNWIDYASGLAPQVIWGLSTPEFADCTACLGEGIQYTDLYDNNESNTLRGNITVQVTIPADTASGPHTLIAAVPYLVGASGGTGLSYFRSNITIS
ncbi:hypothetical protein P7C73_g4259, partial [Tremellales sp. Uapishka_1]